MAETPKARIGRNERGIRTIASTTEALPVSDLVTLVESSVDDDKAEDIVVIDLTGKTSIADFMVIATGASQHQVGAMAEHLRERIKAAGVKGLAIEGASQCDWVLIDAGDVVIHLFRPEVRAFYALEKMWMAPLPGDAAAPEPHAGALA